MLALLVVLQKQLQKQKAQARADQLKKRHLERENEELRELLVRASCVRMHCPPKVVASVHAPTSLGAGSKQVVVFSFFGVASYLLSVQSRLLLSFFQKTQAARAAEAIAEKVAQAAERERQEHQANINAAEAQRERQERFQQAAVAAAAAQQVCFF